MLTPKLSRELSALQLSPTSSVISRSRGRTRSSSESQSSNSDTENEAPPNNVTRGQKDSNFEMTEETVAAVMNHNQRQQMLKNNPHFLRSKEAKVKKAASLNLPLNFESVQSAAAGASPTTVMSLRPRHSSQMPATPSGGQNRKRKSELLRSSVSTPPSKSPRIVNKSKPVMTRSRTARVLQLKK